MMDEGWPLHPGETADAIATYCRAIALGLSNDPTTRGTEMATEVLKESYVLATGYAALMGADATAQHLFARHYDRPITVDELAVDWATFVATSRARDGVDAG